MKKILKGYLIAKYTNMVGSYSCGRLLEEAEKKGIDLKLIGTCDLCFFEGKFFHRGQLLERRDFIINRYKFGHLKDELSNLAARSYNEISAFNIYLDKFKQLENIKSSNFKNPKFILATADKKYEFLKRDLGEKFVAKGLTGSEGDEIYLIKNQEDLKNINEKYGPEKEWVFEEFIEQSFGRDLRIYSIRGRAVGCMMRKSEKDFRANFALGGKVSNFEVTPKINDICKDIYKITGLDFLGIDLLFGKDDLYFCEVNVAAGIMGMEKASGVNIAGKILETIREDFNE